MRDTIDRPGDAASERIDGLISAAMDGELEAVERAELDHLIATDSSVAARVQALHRVDEELRELGREAVDGLALEEGFDALRARIAVDRAARPRWLVAPIAAAAAFFLFLSVSPRPEGIVPEVGADDPLSDAELALALGYVEGPEGGSPLSGIPLDDFEIVEQLELLDYLSILEAKESG